MHLWTVRDSNSRRRGRNKTTARRRALVLRAWEGEDRRGGSYNMTARRRARVLRGPRRVDGTTTTHAATRRRRRDDDAMPRCSAQALTIAAGLRCPHSPCSPGLAQSLQAPVSLQILPGPCLSQALSPRCPASPCSPGRCSPTCRS